jgi:predicted transcriptional regulator
MANSDQYIKPTESELEILQVLWSEGNATVRKVHEAMAGFKDAGYTTTLKLMQIMHEKGLVGRDDSGKSHIYFALASKEKTQQQFLGKMMNTLFDGSPSQLMMQALGGNKPSKEEIEKIEQLLKQYK